MKIKSGLLMAFFILLLSVNFIIGQEGTNKNKIAILPFQSIGIDETSMQTAEFLLKQEIEKLNGQSVTYAKDLPEACSEIECAVKVGKELNTDQIVIGTMSKLGLKIIVHFMLIEVNSGNAILNDNLTAATVEDLEVVMKRIALSVFQQKPIQQTAQVGAITQKETWESNRRGANKYAGISFGYVFPENGYDEVDKSFTMDFRTGFELEKFTVGSHFALRKGFAANIYASYLTTKTDICPYFGGAFGFHWVNHVYQGDDYNYHDDNWETWDKKNKDGFELTLHGGIRAFRTYNFQILINLDYCVTFNDFDDRALVFTIGLLK